MDGNDYFTVTAAERWSIGMINRLKEKFPEQVQIICENDDGSILARVPKEWMRIVPKYKKNMSEEQRRAASERMKALRANRGN